MARRPYGRRATSMSRPLAVHVRAAVKGDLNDEAVYIFKVRVVSCVTPGNSPQWTNIRPLLVGSATL